MDSSSDEESARISPPTSPAHCERGISPPTSPLAPPNSSPIRSGSPAPSPQSSSSQNSPPTKRCRQSHDRQVSRMTLLRRLKAQEESEDSDENEDAQGRGERQKRGERQERGQWQDRGSPDVEDEQQNVAPDQNLLEESNEGPINNETDSSSSDARSDSSSEAVALDDSGEIQSSDECSSPNRSDDDSDCECESEFEREFIFQGSAISTDEALLKVLELHISQRWTKTNLNATVKLIKSLLPHPNLFPSSGKKLLADLNRLCKFQVESEHFYCCKCMEEKDGEDSVCVNCAICACLNQEDEIRKNCDCKKTGVFFEFSILSQLQYMFEHRGLADAINQYHTSFKKVDGCICDITDGSEYIKIRSNLKNRYDIVLLLNSDGVQLSTSSKQELWPILSVPCEVLPNRRSAFMLVSGVHVGKSKPKMNTFLKPFVSAINNINESGGIMWTHPVTKKVYRSLVVCPVLCADAPAKAIMLNVKNYNHRFGCNVCELKAVQVRIPQNPASEKRRDVTLRRFVFTDNEGRLRTGKRMEALGRLAELRRKSRKGVVGSTVLSELPHFDRGNCIAAEYLHLVLLGVVKYFLKIMCNDKSGLWYIGKHLKNVDAFLLQSIKVPDFIKRLPKGLCDLALFKGSELRAFLLFYSLPALGPYLPNEYFQHWMLLVAAIYILLKEYISEDELNTAEVMLRCFVRDIGTLYHNKFYVYNVHNLLHLCTLVRRWGNLWSTSAFMFENFNGFISSHVHGTKHLGKELLNNIKIIQSTKVLKSMLEDTECRTDKEVEVSGPELFGVLLEREKLSLLEMKMEKSQIFNRIKIKSYIYTSRHYDQYVERANSFIQFCRGPNQLEFGQILHFVRASSEYHCIVDLFKTVHTKIFFLEGSLYRIKHLIPVQSSGDLVVIPVSDIVTKVMKVGMYVCVRPNPYEVNL